jgi:hypothetical protein
LSRQGRLNNRSQQRARLTRLSPRDALTSDLRQRFASTERPATSNQRSSTRDRLKDRLHKRSYVSTDHLNKTLSQREIASCQEELVFHERWAQKSSSHHLDKRSHQPDRINHRSPHARSSQTRDHPTRDRFASPRDRLHKSNSISVQLRDRFDKRSHHRLNQRLHGRDPPHLSNRCSLYEKSSR